MHLEFTLYDITEIKFIYVFFFAIFRVGIMHVVATNIIIWIRTLIKESLEEINEYEIEENAERSSSSMTTLLK